MKYFNKFFFSRITFVVLALLGQIILLIGFIKWFSELFSYFYIFSLILSIIIVLVIVNGKSNPAYKLAWVIPILLFPIFGGVFYLFFGSTRFSKRVKRRMMDKMNKQKVKSLHHSALDKIKDENAYFQSRYIEDYSFYPPYQNTITEYLASGEEKYERLIEELKKAKEYIFLEYFIIKKGHMWEKILHVLKEKAKTGVEVRLIYDDVGSHRLPLKYPRYLEKLGIKCAVFNRLIPILSPWFNHRNHRKIVVIDGKVGITGGVNISDEYINRKKRFGHWKDTAILLKGEAVWNLTVMFLTMWGYLRNINEDIMKYHPIYEKLPNEGFVQPYADNPIDEEILGEAVYLNLISKAQKYIYICTPYLIIDNELLTALSLAAKGGIDVRIITPHKPDKWYVHMVTQSYYLPLIEAGVKIYEYEPGFIHAKSFVVDDKYATVGTINLDYRSLYLHFECGCWLYNTESIKQIKDDFHKTLEVSIPITLETLKKTKLFKRIGQFILRIFSPIL